MKTYRVTFFDDGRFLDSTGNYTDPHTVVELRGDTQFVYSPEPPAIPSRPHVPPYKSKKLGVKPPADQLPGWSSDEIAWDGAKWAATPLAASRRAREPNAKTGMLSIQNAVKQINSPATAASYLTANYDLTGVPAGAQQALRDIYYAYSMLVRRLYSNENNWFDTGE